MAKRDTVEYEIKTIETRKKCPKCGKGYMVSTDKVIFGDPLKFIHKCDTCGHKENYTNTFPYTRFEYKEHDDG